MEEYTEIFRKYSKDERKCSKEVFKLARRIWRGVNNGRFTFADIYKPFGGDA